MKTCLVCQSDSDRAELLRIPVRVEGSLLGEMLVCRGCFDLLGAEEVKSLVAAAVREQAYDPSQFLPADAGASGAPEAEAPEAPRQAAFEATAETLSDGDAFARALGEALAPLLLAQYRRGQGRVNLLTALREEGGAYRFEAVAETP